jgi:hypothetical protein
MTETATTRLPSFWTFKFWSFDIVSDFDIQISDLTSFTPDGYGSRGQICQIEQKQTNSIV